MTCHTTRVCSPLGYQLQHRGQEVCDSLALFLLEVVLFSQYILQGPVSKAVDVAQLSFAVEDFLAPFSAEAE